MRKKIAQVGVFTQKHTSVRFANVHFQNPSKAINIVINHQGEGHHNDFLSRKIKPFKDVYADVAPLNASLANYHRAFLTIESRFRKVCKPHQACVNLAALN